MCWRPGCLFKDEESKRRYSGQDQYTKLLVIGATGLTGNALLEAAVACVWFQVFAFTRNAKLLSGNRYVKDGKIKVVEGDMLDLASLRQAMVNIDAVFFNTSYWDTMDSDREYDQGANVVAAASKPRISHIVYVGTAYEDQLAHVPCNYLIGREKVQSLVISSGLPYTIVIMGFYYENLMSVFKPHIVEPLTYAVALPMGNIGLNCGSILDFGHCIAKIILRSEKYIGTVIHLATGYHTVTQLAAHLDRQIRDLSFHDPKIPLHEYMQLDFEGAEDIGAMFLYLQSYPHNVKWDTQPALDLCPSARSLKEWVAENEKGFLEILQEDEIIREAEMPSNRPSVMTEHKKKLNAKMMFRYKEESAQFHRQSNLCEEMTVAKGFMAFWQALLDSDG